jgi:hypothetical protein
VDPVDLDGLPGRGVSEVSLYEKLAEPFPDDVVLTNPKGMPYVSTAYVIDRLNRVLGVDGWSTRTERVRYDDKADSVFATVTLTFHVENSDVQGTRTAGVPVKRYASGDHAGEDVDMGDDFKSAETEALKKAAMDRGVGLYLAMKGRFLAGLPVLEHRRAVRGVRPRRSRRLLRLSLGFS